MTDGSATAGPAKNVSPLLVAIGGHLSQGDLERQHEHAEHMIAWSATATVSLRTGDRDWLVPPTHGLWVPAGCPHQAGVIRPGRAYAVLLEPGRRPPGWTEPAGILITPLVRELIIYLSGPGGLPGPRAGAESLLLDLIEPVPPATFRVPLPRDPRIRAIADSLIASPGDRRDLAAWADASHSSVWTLTRLFTQETGMTFEQWRTLVRVRAALTHLAPRRRRRHHRPGCRLPQARRVRRSIPPGHRPASWHLPPRQGSLNGGRATGVTRPRDPGRR